MYIHASQLVFYLDFGVCICDCICMVKSNNIIVRVSDAEKKLYSEAAIALGDSMSEVARAAWERMVKRAEKKASE